jgi:hypothetical protein
LIHRVRIKLTLVGQLATLLALLIGLTSYAAASTQKVCSAADLRQARSEVDQPGDWKTVYRSFKRFSQCDEGEVAEAYSYAIGRLLAHDWDNLDQLLRLADSDREFAKFVVMHIDENISEDEAQKIVSNSRRRCPPGAKWLCKSIADY